MNLIPNSKEIPDFSTPQYENLISSLLNGACIFFGAGISKFAGYKLWDELRDALVDYFWNKRDTLPSRYLRNQYFDYSMCENLKKDSLIEAFDYLYRISKNLFISGVKNIFITTNIDMGFQTYLGLTDKVISICPDFINPPKLITYLHGRIDKEDTWIFTRAQYNKGYEGEAPCMNYLKNIFKNRSVLFIGYGLREEEIVRAIYSTRKLKAHYWLEGYTRNNIDSLKIRSTNLKENYNIYLIPYSIDNRERSELICEVVDSLYKKITEKERNIK